MAKIQVPYVLIENMEQSEAPGDVTYVYSDDYKGVQLALDYLYREGNRIFGVISTSDTYLVTERRRKAVYDFFTEKKDCSAAVLKPGWKYAVPLSFWRRLSKQSGEYTLMKNRLLMSFLCWMFNGG